MGALGLVVNIIILWNTLYINAALAQLADEGYCIKPEDVARLSRWFSSTSIYWAAMPFQFPTR